MRLPLSIPRGAWALAATLLLASCEKAPVSPTAPSVPVSSVTIAPDADTVAVGDFAQFTATVLDTLGQPEATSVSWQSSDTKVFTVSSSGRVKGISEGTAQLRAA